MFAERWRPLKSSDVLGAAATTQTILKWLTGWKRGSALLLHGPPGCGKSVLVRAITSDLGRDLIKIEDVDDIKAIVGATTQTTLTGKQRIILIDDVDAIAVENRSNVTELIDVIKRSRWPVVLTAIDPWEPAMRSLRQYSMMIAISKLPTKVIAERLKEIAEREGISADLQLLQAAAAISGGDMRAGLNCLEMLAAGADGAELVALDKTRNPFELMSALFKGTNMSSVKQALSEADMDLDEIFSWLETNIFIEWRNPKDVAVALELLSRADMMRRRHAETSRNILTEFALLKGSSGWSRYSTPDRLAMLKQLRSVNVERESLAGRLAPMLHCSKAKIRSDYLPYLHKVVKAV